MRRTQPKVVRLVLPLPPRELSPNARVHWAKKSKMTAMYRRIADGYLRSNMRLWNMEPPHWERAQVQVTFCVRDRRRRDPDNLAASLKAVWDGFTDAGLFADDRGLVHMPVRVTVDPKDPRVMVEILPLPAEDAA